MTTNEILDLNSNVVTMENMALFQCGTNGQCTRVAGFIADKSNSYYYIDATSEASNKDSTDNNYFTDSCTHSNAGKLNRSDSYKFCIGSNQSIPFPQSASHFLGYDGSSGFKMITTDKNVISIGAQIASE